MPITAINYLSKGIFGGIIFTIASLIAVNFMTFLFRDGRLVSGTLVSGILIIISIVVLSVVEVINIFYKDKESAFKLTGGEL